MMMMMVMMMVLVVMVVIWFVGLLLLLRLLLHARAGTADVAAAVTGVAAFAALNRALSGHPHKCGRTAPARVRREKSRLQVCRWRWEKNKLSRSRGTTSLTHWRSHFRTLTAKTRLLPPLLFHNTTLDRQSRKTTLNKDLNAKKIWWEKQWNWEVTP